MYIQRFSKSLVNISVSSGVKNKIILIVVFAILKSGRILDMKKNVLFRYKKITGF